MLGSIFPGEQLCCTSPTSCSRSPVSKLHYRAARTGESTARAQYDRVDQSGIEQSLNGWKPSSVRRVPSSAQSSCCLADYEFLPGFYQKAPVCGGPRKRVFVLFYLYVTLYTDNNVAFSKFSKCSGPRKNCCAVRSNQEFNVDNFLSPAHDVNRSDVTRELTGTPPTTS